MARRRGKTGVCAYCGCTAKLTIDHVIPKCLFATPLPSNTIKVSACERCNCEKSRHDDFLRDALVTDIAGAESPIAAQIFQDKVLSSHRQGKSLLARIALAEGVEKPLLDDSGVPHDIVAQFTVDSERMDQLFRFLIRGLRNSIDGFRYAKGTNFNVSRLLFPNHFEGTRKALKGIRFTGPVRLGEGVFEFSYAIAEDNPNTSIWLLEFYERVVYRAVTRAATRAAV